MTKKSFRAQQAVGPTYPRLKDLEASALRRWGLAVVGGLLLGGAACKQTPPGEPAMTRTEALAAQKAAQARTAQALDAGAPAAPHNGPPGEMPLDRVELEKANTAPEAAPTDVPEGGKHKAVLVRKQHNRVGGGMRPPRLEEKKPPRK